MKTGYKPLMIPMMSIVLVLLVGGIATALTVAKISLDQLTRDADLIVHGTVLSSGAQWEEKNIYTYTSINVREVLKGHATGEVEVKQLGGRVADMEAVVDGTPELKPGDELVLFLREWNGHYWIHSIVLGKFSVVYDGGVPMVINDLNNIGLVDPATNREITDPNEKFNRFELASFFNQVRSLSNKEDGQ